MVNSYICLNVRCITDRRSSSPDFLGSPNGFMVLAVHRKNPLHISLISATVTTESVTSKADKQCGLWAQ